MLDSAARRAALAAAALVLATAGTVAAQESKDASEATRAANQAVLDALPFGETQAFDDAHKGFIAPLSPEIIKGASGATIWDPGKYAFIKEGEPAPDTVNPSLWRQSQLINIAGLYEVTEGIYQIRNLDLSNMTVIEGETGILVVDPMISVETAKAGLDLYYANRGEKPVVAVIYTHSHVDHWGGVRGVVDEADVAAGKVKIFAPAGFLEAAVSENVLAGNAMSRRASYMYGNLLPPDPKGQVGAGLAMTTSAGTVSLIAPTDTITETGQTAVIDGLTYEFLMAPHSEAPSEMLFYMPEKKVLNVAEDAVQLLHNTMTLRGAKIREPLVWSKYLNETLAKWGGDVEILYAQHHWPIWGNDRAVRHLKLQRDMYRYINDETLRLTNHGYTMVEIAEMFQLPETIEKSFSNRGYYGTYSHNVKATYVLYMGWFNGNPATLHELPPAESGKHYVEMMGGADAVLEKARTYYDAGDYRWVAQVVNHVVFAEPDNQAARDLQADALEQLGYQAESGIWRNFYLTGAKELRDGVQELPAPSTNSADLLGGMSLDLFFDYLGVRLNHPKVDGKQMVLNFDFPDTGQKYVLELGNGVLNHTAGMQSADADATVTLNRTTLDAITLGQMTLKDAAASGDVKVEGDQAKLGELMSYMDTFGFWFNIVTPNQIAAQ